MRPDFGRLRGTNTTIASYHPETVRICTGNSCTDQPRSAALPQAAPSAHEAQAQLRLQQLEALAETAPMRPTIWGCA